MNSTNKITAVIGLGYVGLPLLLEFCHTGQKVIGFDLDQKKVDSLNEGISYISYIEDGTIQEFLKKGLFSATTDFNRLSEVDSIVIAVPTPLNDHREPDISFVKNSAEVVSDNLKKGQLIVLESTTYPGTTREVVLPLLEKSGLKVGRDFFLAYSPERVDPNNQNFSAREIPKVIGGITERCLDEAVKLYNCVFEQIVTVSTVEAAEASKLLENIFRSVNIALVNELKMLFDRMNIDIWEIIKASSTKPFGFMPFYPGPGLGGHCIPIDPFYLTWKAREYDFSTRFIELAGEINNQMPYFILQKTTEALNSKGQSLKDSQILIIGVAYKKDVDDIRESPAVKLITLLQKKGAEVSYYDPYIPVIKNMRRYPGLKIHSVELTKEQLEQQDCSIIITDHSRLNYSFILDHSNLVIDTRNVFEAYKCDKVIKS